MFTASSGRTLSFDDVGDHTGHPVLYLHGTPDSRLARHPDDELLNEAGVRLIAVDRPGYSASTPPDLGAPKDIHKGFAADVSELLHSLRLDDVSLLAWSGGALSAVALAADAHLATKVDHVVVVAGIVPREAYDDGDVLAAAQGRATLLDMADEMTPEDFAGTVAPMLAPSPCDLPTAREHQGEQREPLDQEALSKVPGAAEQMARALVEGVSRGLGGVAADLVAQSYLGTVGDLSTVEVPVSLVYGDGDTTAPPSFGRWYQRRLPNAELRVEPGAGHVLLLTHWREILSLSL